MKILSLFDGMSVAQQALKNCKIKIDEYFASEIDPYAIATTQANHPNTIQMGDVCKLGKEIPYPKDLKKGIDLMIFGSPCTDLSIAKRDRKGLKGEESGLFFEAVRIMKDLKPKYFIMENVASMSKESKEEISKILGIDCVLINAALVSAQQRKRLFWVGKINNRGGYDQVEISQPEDRNIYLKDIIIDGIAERNKSLVVTATYSRACPQDYFGKSNRQLIKVGEFNSGGQGDRIYSVQGKSVTLSGNGGGRGAKTGVYAVSIRGRNIVNGKRKDIIGAKTQQRLELSNSEKAHTITSVQKDSLIEENYIYRKLHTIETLRLQSMPDYYFDKAEYKGKPISDTQRYRQYGNAFNCAVIEHIIKHLFIKK